MSKSIQTMFEPLASRYELVNHVFTFGLDAVWRTKAAEIATRMAASTARPAGRTQSGGTTAGEAQPSGTEGEVSTHVWLDVSTGTGEMAEVLSRRAATRTLVVASDFSLPMLRGALNKKRVHGATPTRRDAGAQRILLIASDDQQLPVRDASVDLVTISLGTRNLNASRDALVSCFREFYRVLKSGGRFVNLETSQPNSRLVRALFHGYVRRFVRPLASVLSGNSSAYSYLASTVCSFYEADELSGIIKEAGFSRVDVARLFLGVAAIHAAEK